MRHSTTLVLMALLSLAAQPALSQERPQVLFCKGQCYGIDKAGQRVPLNKGTELAPGLRLETGPDSYMQVKLGKDAAFGMGERARVRLESLGIERAALALDQGRVRVLDGEAIGKATTRLVELQTSEGNIVLRGADIEVKTPPIGDTRATPTLLKVNLGDARLGGLPVTRDAVYGIADGKIARTMPTSDIVLTTRTDSLPTDSTRLAVSTLPVTDLTVSKLDLTTATISPTLSVVTLDPSTTTIRELSTFTTNLSKTTLSTTTLDPIGSKLQYSSPLPTTTGDTVTLRQIANTVELSKTTSTFLQPLDLKTTTLSNTTLSPKLLTTTPTFQFQTIK